MNQAVVASIDLDGRYALIEVASEFFGAEDECVDLLLPCVPTSTPCLRGAIDETLRQIEAGVTLRTVRFAGPARGPWHDAALAVASILAITGRSLRPDVAAYPVVGRLLPTGALVPDPSGPKPPWYVGAQYPCRGCLGTDAETVGEIAFCLAREGSFVPEVRPVAYLATGTDRDHLPDGWLEVHPASGSSAPWATYPVYLPVDVAERYRLSRKVVLTDADLDLLTERGQRGRAKV